MRTALRIQMTTDIRKSVTAAIYSLMNMKPEKACFVLRQTDNFSFYKNTVLLLKE